MALTLEQQIEAAVLKDRIRDVVGRRAVDQRIAEDLMAGRMTVESIELVPRRPSEGTLYLSETGDEVIIRCRLVRGISSGGQDESASHD